MNSFYFLITKNQHEKDESEEELEKFFYWKEERLSAGGVGGDGKIAQSFPFIRSLLMLFNVSEHNFPPS